MSSGWGGAAGVDHRADLYATATVAYRALSGRLPHSGLLQAAVMHGKLNTDARSLRAATGLTWPRLIEAFFEHALSARTRTPAVETLRVAAASAEDDDEGTVLEGPARAR